MDRKLILGGPGAGKTTKLLNEVNSSESKSLLLSYNVNNVRSAQLRLTSGGTKCKTLYAFIYSLYREITNARQRAPRELIDDGVTRFIARKAILNAKKDRYITRLTASSKTVNTLVELTDRVIHKANVIPVTSELMDSISSDVLGIEGKDADLLKVIPEYLRLIRCENGMLFSEMLSIVMQTCSRKPIFIERALADVSLLMVDEIQDLSILEIDFVCLLVDQLSIESKVILAGDLNQCITQYRGADVSYLVNKLDVMGFTKQQLTQQYRFGVHAAHFSKPFQNYPHEVECLASSATRVRLGYDLITPDLTFETDNAALLTRTKEQSLVYQFVLDALKTPYTTVDGRTWRDTPLFLVLLGFATLCTNADVDQYPYLIAKSMVRNLLYYPYRNAPVEVINVLCAEDPKTAFNGLTAASILGANTLGGLPHFMIKAQRAISEDILFHDFLAHLIKNPHFNHEVRRVGQPYSLLVHLHRLTKGSQMRISDFIKLYITIPKCTGRSPVRLLTMHGSKGLEFKHVYIGALHCDSFPLTTESTSDAESLLYVALTRGRKSTTLLIPEHKRSSLLDKIISIGKIA